jgi:uncharacterized protein YkwD
MKKIKFFISVLCLALFPFAATHAAVVLNQMEKNVFNMINQNRVAHSLAPLTWSDTVAQQARMHSINMADKVVPFGHQGFDTRFATLSRLIPGLTSMGENVAWNQGYSKPGAAAVQMWLNSPGHYANIMGDFNLTGVGVAKDPQGRHYFTQIFVKAGSSIQTDPDSESENFSNPQQAISETPCFIEIEQ